MEATITYFFERVFSDGCRAPLTREECQTLGVQSHYTDRDTVWDEDVIGPVVAYAATLFSRDGSHIELLDSTDRVCGRWP